MLFYFLRSCLMSTYRCSFGSRETNVSGLASRSSGARRSSTAILSGRTLKEENEMMIYQYEEKCVFRSQDQKLNSKDGKNQVYSQKVPPFLGVQSFQGFLGDPLANKYGRY